LEVADNDDDEAAFAAGKKRDAEATGVVDVDAVAPEARLAARAAMRRSDIVAVGRWMVG